MTNTQTYLDNARTREVFVRPALPAGPMQASAVGGFARWWRSLRSPSRRLSLALQGGGAHGAFTWGVLDALLDEPGLEFEGLSGSSAGAMNAVVFANGWMSGGREGARQALEAFWTAVSRHLPIALVPHGEGEDIALSPTSKLLVSWAANFSPSQLNPLDLNPLRDVLREQVDFERLRTHSPFKLFIGTTQASTGKLRVFREHELSVDVLLASACLPRIHHSVEIDGEPYWDGGYSANPAVFPLLMECESPDVLLVLLSPLQHNGTPHSKNEIESRIAELTFSANFMREMQMFACAQQAAVPLLPGLPGRQPLQRRLQRAHFHMIDTSSVVSLHRTDTKMLAYAPFLELLRDQGRERGQAWRAEALHGVGRRSTIDVQGLFG